MEKLYYILDSSTNIIVIDNLTKEQSIDWLIKNGNPIIHICMEK